MLLQESSLRAIQRYCTHNRALLERSTSAGCVCCGATFSPNDVKEWATDAEREPGESPMPSAVCPHCGRDSVLPSAAPVMLSPQLLAAVQQYWFKHVS